MRAMLLTGSLVLIVAATTMPWSWYYVGHSHWGSVEWIPFSQRFRPDDLVLNVLLFVPFGFTALRLTASGGADNDPDGTDGTSPSPRAIVGTVIAGCLISIAVEWFQVYCHWRMPTSVDVIANTLGAWAGTRVASRFW